MSFSLTPLFGGDSAALETVSKIRGAIYLALRDPQQRLRRRAEQILRSGGVGERNETAEVTALAGWVRTHFHYVHDPSGIEYVKTPEVIDDEITRYGEFLGDCDDASGYLAALLKSVGYHVALVIMADPRNPNQTFSHIYTQVYAPRMKRWITLDMTAKGKPLGWQANASRLRRYDV